MLLLGPAKLALIAGAYRSNYYGGIACNTLTRCSQKDSLLLHLRHHQKRSSQQRAKPSSTMLAATDGASFRAYDNADDGASLGAARAMLFDDQHKALGDQAEQEALLLDPNMTEMQQLSSSSKKKNKKKQKQRRRVKSAGVGFGSSSSSASASAVKSSMASSNDKFDEQTELYAAAVEEDGVVLVPHVIKKETAAKLRECLVKENEVMRDMIRADPSKSISLFYVPADIHFSTPRGYVLLPFRDTESVQAGPQHVGTLVQATRELLAPATPLSQLFGRMCDRQDSQLYDFCALRTEPGAARQVVHSDTPHQDIAGLFCAFIALQDVTMPMGGTMFIPKTHDTRASVERQRFDSGNAAERNGMLQNARAQYTMLKAGDAAFFDMRTLHAGLPNLPAEQGGANRLLWAITFRNLNAKEALGHKPNIRPGYVGLYTLGGFQKELATEAPFAGVGNGLLP